MTPLARLLALAADLLDEAAAAEVTPEALAAYAERTGWTLLREDPERRVYRNGSLWELHVPRSSGWPAYGRRVLAELRELAAAEGRSSLAVWADLVGLTGPRPATHETPPPCPEVAPGEAIGASDGPEVVRTSAEPTTGQPAQGVLPGVEPGGRERRRSVHRWGVIRWETLPPDPLDPERDVIAAVQTCPHCRCQRRRANTGARLGAEDMYSRDGREWSHVNPACVAKD